MGFQQKSIYGSQGKNKVEEHFSPGQFAYREDGNYTDPLLAIQHTIQKYLDSPECRAVRLYAIKCSKAFDSVKHYLSAAIVKKRPKIVLL